MRRCVLRVCLMYRTNYLLFVEITFVIPTDVTNHHVGATHTRRVITHQELASAISA